MTPQKNVEGLKAQDIIRKEVPSFGHRSFTTQPKMRRLVLRKQQTVRNRAHALQESFYPTTDVRYEAVRERMGNVLGLYDDQTVLAYLGRPSYERDQTVEQTVVYKTSGATVEKRHYFRQKLPAKKGYVESLSLGYVFVEGDEWWVHWNHKKQLALPESEGVEQQKVSKEDFSLTKMETEDSIVKSKHSIGDGEKREYSKAERKSQQSVKSQRCLYSELYPRRKAQVLSNAVILCDLDKKIHRVYLMRVADSGRQF